MTSRRILLSVCALAICLIGVQTEAVAGPGLFAGVSLPTGDFGDAYKLGFHGGAEFTYPVTPLASIGVRGAFNRFAFDTAAWGEGVDGNVIMVEVLGVGKIATPAGLFFVAGLGLTASKVSFDLAEDYSGIFDDADPETETDFTAVGGAGFSVLPFEVTALYHNISTEGESTAYITVSAGIGF